MPPTRPLTPKNPRSWDEAAGKRVGCSRPSRTPECQLITSDYLHLPPAGASGDSSSDLGRSAQTNGGGKRGGTEGAENRQTLNMQTVKKDKLVTNWNVWSESGYVYILK